MFIISFDFGMKNIGIAIGQFYTKTANPIISINAKNGIPVNWMDIKKILDIWLIKIAVIGYPYYYIKNNKCKLIKIYIKNFANNLINKFNLKIFFSDERFTSCAARNFINCNFKLYNSFYSNYDIHAISAVLILERWLKLNS